MSSLHRLVRPIVLLAVLLAIGTFVVAEPGSASPATVATASAASADLDSSMTIAVTVPQSAATEVDSAASDVQSAGFAPIADMPAKVVHAAPAPPAPVPTKTQTPAVQAANSGGATQAGYGCGPALAYLAAHSAPGFTFQCPGYAFGNQAMTCVNHAPQCAGQKIIAIAVPCPAAYMNEAHNSWVLIGQATGIDPYGYCH